MALNESAGIFAQYYLNLKNAKGPEFDKEVEKINGCHDDYDRMVFLEQISGINEYDKYLQVQRSFDGKDATIAADLKEKGNLAFKAKKWLEAMILYTKSYVALPEENRKEKSIILANRSATLYHMEKHDEALIDIKRSIDFGYPKDLIYKLYERQARCFMAKKNYPNTIKAFKKCITAMDDAKLPADKQGKMTLDAMTMIKMLERDPRTAKQEERLKKHEDALPSLCIPDEKEFFSSAISFDQNREEGRFARAARDVKVGEEILIEKPFVAVLLGKFSKTHCENCFVRTAIPVACPKCADVVYCSEKCLNRAAKRYHKYECGLLPTIWRSGASINCHMALRILASKPVEEFLKYKDELDNSLTIEEIRNLPLDDFRRVSHLVRHQDKRSASNFFQHTLMARFLNKCLEAASYYGPNPKKEDQLTIGSFLLRCLQFIEFNTHEVVERHKSAVDGSEKTAFIGGGLYPTLALFNHSCDPGVVRYFRGTTIHINTVKSIEAGLPISENYGPIYTQETRDVRQEKLKDLYRFECTCDPCLENWPTFDNLPTDVIRFRCEAPNNCNSVVEVPPTCNDFMVTCSNCGGCTNILKGLKVMQDTEMMSRTAKRFYDAGEYSKALNKNIDLIRIMYEVLAPPFPDYCQCQQNLKDCLLHFGNFYNLDYLPLDDFRRVSHLVRHQDKRSASNFFQHALMARFLNKCLDAAGYYGPNPKKEDQLTIGSFLLRCLQFIQFNTHEVAELHKSAVDGSEKTAFIGGGLYPTLALFNHSCDPGVVRYFRGTTIHINTVKPIEAGLPISENYGPMYTQETREVRQEKMKDLYWFDCTCDPCLENWPTFDNLPTDVIRFRCEAPNNCNSVVEVPPTCNDFMITCSNCGGCTNILKGLKVMQDTEMMSRTAKRFYDAGEYSKALNKNIDLIRIMYEVLAPPFPDYCQCQQNLKDCLLHFGNFYNLE